MSCPCGLRLSFRGWMVGESLALAGSYKGGIFQRLVAAQYKLAPLMEQDAIEGFYELARKLGRQQQFLRHTYNFIPSAEDHYASMKQLKASIDAQRQAGQKRADMYVYAEPPGPEGQPSQQGHPIFSNDVNVMIRGVHDAIAHLAGNHPFSARGEYAAYNQHLKTLCNPQDLKGGACKSAPVLFTEIVGQTSYYYVYGKFAAQKAVILRDFDHARVGALAAGSPLNRYFLIAGKQLVSRPDFDEARFGQEFPDLHEELSSQVSRPKLQLQPLHNQQP